MGWFRIEWTEEQQHTVQVDREHHPESHVRRKMLVLRLLHCKVKRAAACKVAGIGRATLQRYVQAFRDGGLDGLRRWDVKGPVSALSDFSDLVRISLHERPVRTVAEACERLEQWTGLKRGPTQVRQFLAGLGFSWLRARAVPVPPKKT